MAGLWLLTVPLDWVGAVAMAACFHELGHLLALWWMGERVWSLEIGAFGLQIETGELPPKGELFCALAGPAAGVLVCLGWRLWPKAALVAACQTVFNLLPLHPLDGGRALGAARKICCK